MRIGTTSYIYPTDILSNVRKLAGSVQDIELLLFEFNEEKDLPDQKALEELSDLAQRFGFSYTIHLPLDLGLAGASPKLNKAIQVIQHMQGLSPHAFIVHVSEECCLPMAQYSFQLENALKSLDIISKKTGELERICIENLSHQSPEFMSAVLERLPISCCVDVGHLWRQNLDPLEYLELWRPRTQVVHLYGVGEQDHEGLSVVPPEKIDPVTSFLCRKFRGIVTLENFNEEDFYDSLKAFERSVERFTDYS